MLSESIDLAGDTGATKFIFYDIRKKGLVFSFLLCLLEIQISKLKLDLTVIPLILK